MKRHGSTKSNDALRKDREVQKWTQEVLAQKVGVQPLTVALWEKGEYVPTRYARLKLCSVFGKSEEELGLVRIQQDERNNEISEEDAREEEIGLVRIQQDEQIVQKFNEIAQEENPLSSGEQLAPLESEEAVHGEEQQILEQLPPDAISFSPPLSVKTPHTFQKVFLATLVIILVVGGIFTWIVWPKRSQKGGKIVQPSVNISLVGYTGPDNR